MKRFSLTMVAIIVVTIFLFADFAFAGRVKHRQVRQQKRIHQGVASGELTKREVYRLEREQAQVQRSKRRALSDGTLTARERLRLEKKQDSASRHIYRAKHNGYNR